MNKFIIKVLLLIGIIIFLMSIKPLLGLYALQKDYLFPNYGSVKLIKSKGNNSNKILIIGCSNLQHNIDFKLVQNSVKTDVDFLYFAGSQNSTFLRYLVKQGYTKNYKAIVLYAPYHILKKTKFATAHVSNYINYGSYTYAKDLISNNPFSFFYDWKMLADSIKSNRPKCSMSEKFVTFQDDYMDSISNEVAQYKDCLKMFNRDKHVIDIPTYSKEDIYFLNSIKQDGQKLYIAFPPIPNIDVNIKGLERFKKSTKSYFENTLNEPVVLDSMIFFDQWYHMNACGRDEESIRMINYLIKLESNN